MKDFIKIMKALSDPNRVKIIKMLQHKTMCVCEMREALQVSQPTVSKNLKILEDAGLVEHKRDGQWINYELSVDRANEFVQEILNLIEGCLNNDPIVKNDLKLSMTVDRNLICKK